jgi:hypothetical protein
MPKNINATEVKIKYSSSEQSAGNTGAKREEETEK